MVVREGGGWDSVYWRNCYSAVLNKLHIVLFLFLFFVRIIDL